MRVLVTYFSFTYRNSTTMYAFPMWIKCLVHREKWRRCMFLFTRSYWKSIWRLSPWVCNQFRLCTKQGMCAIKVPRPMPRNLRSKCRVPSDQSFTVVHMYCWIHRRSIPLLQQTTRWWYVYMRIFTNRYNMESECNYWHISSFVTVIENDRTDPCSPSPCGPNSICRQNNGQAVCSCLPTYSGSPPNCRPECVVSSECPTNRACINQKCADPCPDPCGRNANCKVINHSPICTCQQGYTGDAFSVCFPTPRKDWYNFFKLESDLTISNSLRSTSRQYTTHSKRPVSTLTLWSVFWMPWYWRYTILLLLSYLHRNSTKL